MTYQELLEWANRPHPIAESMKKRYPLPQGFYYDEDGDSHDEADLTPMQRQARRAAFYEDQRGDDEIF